MPEQNTILLKVAYGVESRLPSSKIDGTMYVLTDSNNHKLGFKLPGQDLFYIKGDGYPTALHNPNYVTMYYGADDSTSTSYDGSVPVSIYSGTRTLIATAATHTVSSNGNDPYVIIQDRTGQSTWITAGGFQLKGGTATTVSSNNGVITISSPSIPTSLKNPNSLSIFYGTSATAATSYDGSAPQSIYVGTRPIAATSSTATSSSNGTNPYLIFQHRTGGTDTPTWANTGSIQIKGGTATTVQSLDGAIVISSPSIPTTLKNPNALTWSTTATTHSDVSYDGSKPITISYNNVGAAPASNISLGALNWTAPSTGWTIPASLIPKEAMLDLVYVNSTDVTTATGVQAGDIVQTNDDKLWYITAVSNGKPTSTGYKEIKVGNSAYAAHAGYVDATFAVYDGNTTQIASYNGSQVKAVYVHHGLVLTNSASSTSKAAGSNGSVFINHIHSVTGSTVTPAVSESIKIVGATNISVTSTTAGVITITGVESLKNPSSLSLIGGDKTLSYDGSAAKTFKFEAGTGMSVTATTATGTQTLKFTPTAYSGAANGCISISDYVISHNVSTLTAGDYGTGATAITGDVLSLPKFSIDTYGHVTGCEYNTITFPFTPVLEQGDISCYFMGHTIYTGVVWDTF